MYLQQTGKGYLFQGCIGRIFIQYFKYIFVLIKKAVTITKPLEFDDTNLVVLIY
jgi:hypothetical protein